MYAKSLLYEDIRMVIGNLLRIFKNQSNTYTTTREHCPQPHGW